MASPTAAFFAALQDRSALRPVAAWHSPIIANLQAKDGDLCSQQRRLRRGRGCGGCAQGPVAETTRTGPSGQNRPPSSAIHPVAPMRQQESFRPIASGRRLPDVTINQPGLKSCALMAPGRINGSTTEDVVRRRRRKFSQTRAPSPLARPYKRLLKPRSAPPYYGCRIRGAAPALPCIITLEIPGSRRPGMTMALPGRGPLNAYFRLSTIRCRKHLARGRAPRSMGSFSPR